MPTYNAFDELPRDCWVDVDTVQLANNLKLLSKTVNSPILAVVKANGYGHGYLHAAKAFVSAGASYLGVATLAEGLILQEAGIRAPILVICAMLPHEMKLAIEAGIEFLVFRDDHIAALRQMASKQKPARVHLKVNTGMGRLGCWPHEAPQLAESLGKIEGVELVGLITHFSSAYNPTSPDTESQIARFTVCIEALAAVGIRPPLIHAANSSGALYYPSSRFDMVRFGISLYGVPGDMIQLPAGVEPAFSWRARLTSTTVLPQGHGVSYASEYVMPEEGRIGVIPVGYADGFQRVPKNVNWVLVEGKMHKTLGRICMDQTMIDLSGLGDLTGAEVVLLGRQGDEEISVQNIAKRWGTNAYDVYCGVAARVPRHVV